MPQIPDYASKLPLPVESTPRIPNLPADTGTAVGNAMARGGAQVADVGFKLFDQELDLKRQAQLVDLSTQASLDLHKLRTKAVTDPSFFQDPEAAGNNFATQTKELQQTYMDQITDPRVASAFKSHFAKESIAHLSGVADAAIKQRNLLGEGAFENAIVRLGTLADSAASDTEAQQYMGQAKAYLDQMQNLGLMKPDAKVTRVEKFMNDRAEHRVRALALTDPQAALDTLANPQGVVSLLRPDRSAELAKLATSTLEHKLNTGRAELARQEKIAADAENFTNYKTLRDSFGLNDPVNGDFTGAVREAENPNSTVVKYTSKDPTAQIREVSGMVETQRNQIKSAREDQIKVTNETTNNQMLQYYQQNKLTPDIILSSGLPVEKQNQWQNALKSKAEAGDKHDPVAFNSEYTRVLTGQVGRKDDIQLPGNGLTGKDVAFLREEYDKAQDPTKSKYYVDAGQEYALKFNGMPELKQKREEFLATLADQVKRDKLEGAKIYGRARDLMAEDSRKWTDSLLSVVPFSGVPWRAPLRFETESPYNPQTAVPAPSTAITKPVPLAPEVQTKYETVLKNAGKPVTDANLRFLYDQDAKRGTK